MRIESLKINNFRNYELVNLKFHPKLNIIYGKNGSGKTNIVEAIYVLGLTKSFRTKDDKNIIRKGFNSTKIEGKINNNSSDIYQIVINSDGKKVKINSTQESKLSNYISNINIILFQPEDQMLLKQPPNIRRKMLNIEISQLNKNYIINLNNYNKILKQRNFYLREMMINANATKDYLDILTDKLIDYGLKIHNERLNFIDNINKSINDIYKYIFGKGELKVKYVSDYNNKELDDIKKMYQNSLKYDINTGKTNNGIQHDDIDFILDDNNLKEWGSIGEQKNAIFSFKLAEIEIFKTFKYSTPILILDDIFSELDKSKVKNIIEILDDNIQTFITTTEIDRISKKLSNKAKKFRVKEGNIEEVIKNERKSL